MSLHLTPPKIAGVPLKPGRFTRRHRDGRIRYQPTWRQKNAGNPRRARQRTTRDSWRLLLSSPAVCLRERCRFFSFIQPSDEVVFNAQSIQISLLNSLQCEEPSHTQESWGGGGLSEKIEMLVRLPPALCDPAGALWGPADAIAPFAAAALVKLRR